MLIQALGCGFQNEATITASIQMPLDLTFYARRELPFQVPTNQMDRIPTGHILSGHFKSGQRRSGENRPREMARNKVFLSRVGLVWQV
jgi:hypothetical protein